MKTTIQIEIEHAKPLPTKTPITDVVADRTYNYLFANGSQVGVRVMLVSEELDASPSMEGAQ